MPTPDVPAVAATARPRLAITAGVAVSRATGFARVLAVGAVLGTTFTGNTYQSANLVSNVMFELLAAGLLASVLVPRFVALIDDGRRQEATDLAGAALGIALAGLAVVVVALMAAAPWVMRGLTAAVGDDAVRAQEVRLGGFLLVFFAPQLLLYVTGAVSTALLHADRRFTAPAIAPACNNVAVIATMVAFRVMEGPGRPSLDLELGPRLLLAFGTTAGVAAMVSVPLVTAWRAGLRVRPRWDPRHPGLRAMRSAGLWGAGYLALNQVLVVTTLVLANRVPGGVVAYQIAYTFFLLPFALLANPVAIASYPRLAAAAHRGEWADVAAELRAGLRSTATLVALASAVLVALGPSLVRVVQLGAIDAAGSRLIGRVLAAYALGLLGYAGLNLLTRASYAAGDTRTPTLVNLGVAAGGSSLMIVLFSLTTGGDRVVAVGLAYAAAVVAGGLVLLGAVTQRVGRLGIGSVLVKSAVAAIAAGLAAAVVAAAVGGEGRAGAVADVAAGAVVAAAVYAAVLRVTGMSGIRGRGPAA